MRADDLIARLRELPPDTEVLAYDADGEGFFPVTGYVLHTPTPGQVDDFGARPQIELQTDLLL